MKFERNEDKIMIILVIMNKEKIKTVEIDLNRRITIPGDINDGRGKRVMEYGEEVKNERVEIKR